MRPKTHNFATLAAGDDASLLYLQGGYLLPSMLDYGQLQPYLRYETAQVDQKSDTDFWSAGLNYYLQGHGGKISLDYTLVDYGTRDAKQGILTVQVAVGI
jgi:phosphate-selective porin